MYKNETKPLITWILLLFLDLLFFLTQTFHVQKKDIKNETTGILASVNIQTIILHMSGNTAPYNNMKKWSES